MTYLFSSITLLALFSFLNINAQESNRGGCEYSYWGTLDGSSIPLYPSGIWFQDFANNYVPGTDFELKIESEANELYGGEFLLAYFIQYDTAGNEIDTISNYGYGKVILNKPGTFELVKDVSFCGYHRFNRYGKFTLEAPPVLRSMSIEAFFSESSLNVDLKHAQQGTCRIIDIYGSVISTTLIEEGENVIVSQSLNTGVYIICVEANGQHTTKKVVRL